MESSSQRINHLIESNLYSVENTVELAKLPEAKNCFEVVKVAPVSIAGRAQIQLGDWLVKVDDYLASDISSRIGSHLYLLQGSQHCYEFYRPSNKKQLVLRTSGIDLGVELRLTPEAIAAAYNPNNRYAESLDVLWELGCWHILETLSKPTLNHYSGLCGLINKVIHGVPIRSTPVVVLLGAALYEKGEQKRGMSLIREFLQQHARSWTLNFHAIGLYYVGLEILKQGHRGEAIEMLLRAFDRHPYQRIANQLTQLTGRLPQPLELWKSKIFPINYRLNCLNRGGTVDLTETLNRLKPYQILLVCLLAGYRGNGPYNDFMAHLCNFFPYFSEIVPAIHVITTEKTRRPDRPYWYEAEDKAKAANIPFFVLLDEHWKVTETIEPNRSPEFFVLNPTGRVLHHGNISSLTLWKSVALACQET